jgi:hypothetical protein
VLRIAQGRGRRSGTSHSQCEYTMQAFVSGERNPRTLLESSRPLTRSYVQRTRRGCQRSKAISEPESSPVRPRIVVEFTHGGRASRQPDDSLTPLVVSGCRPGLQGRLSPGHRNQPRPRGADRNEEESEVEVRSSDKARWCWTQDSGFRSGSS